MPIRRRTNSAGLSVSWLRSSVDLPYSFRKNSTNFFRARGTSLLYTVRQYGPNFAVVIRPRAVRLSPAPLLPWVTMGMSRFPVRS